MGDIIFICGTLKTFFFFQALKFNDPRNNPVLIKKNKLPLKCRWNRFHGGLITTTPDSLCSKL